MKHYSITYDLRSPGQNYSALYEAIKSFGTYAKPTESQWIVKSQLTSREIYNRLAPHLDSNDLIFVAAIDLADVWWVLSKPVADWVKGQSGFRV